MAIRGVARTFLLGGCESLNLPTATLYFFLHKFLPKGRPLKIYAAKSDKKKTKRKKNRFNDLVNKRKKFPKTK